MASHQDEPLRQTSQVGKGDEAIVESASWGGVGSDVPYGSGSGSGSVRIQSDFSETESGNDGEHQRKAGRKKSFMQTFSRKETIRQVAIFANNISLGDDEGMEDDKGDEELINDMEPSSDEVANETGTERLQRALTTEEKHKGLFRYTNTLGSAVGIEPDILMRVALEDEWQMVSCASLPFTILFFVVFMLFFQLHYGVTDIFLAEAALRTKLAIAATEISEAQQIYGWLENYYFPFLWAAKRDEFDNVQLNSESLYQDIVAGVRVTTTRANQKTCEDELVGYMDCYSDKSDSVMPGTGVFGVAALPALLQSGGRRLVDSEAELERWHERERLAKARAQATTEDEEDLPDWARPGLSEGFKRHQKSHGNELYSAPRPRRRTAEAHDWRDASSPAELHSQPDGSAVHAPPRVLSDASGGRWEPKQPRSPPPDGWNVGSTIHRKQKGWMPFRPKRKDTESRRLKVNRPEIRPVTPRLGDGNMSQVVIPISWTLDEVLKEVHRWKTARVIQATTLTFGTQALIINKNLGHDMLSSVAFEFSIHRGGNVFTEVKLISVVLTTVTSSAAQTCLACAWVICLVAFSLMLPSRAFLRWKQGRLRSHFLRFWNLLEWGIISWGWMVFGMFVIERSMILNLKNDIEDYQKLRATLPPSEHYALDTSAAETLWKTSSTLSDLASWCQMVVALFHIILVCRFFLASRGQPRLAVVLSTIRKASIDLFHLFIVFMIIFIAYAVSGHILFGRRLQEFATFQGAFARCFQIVMEREYTWTEFTEEDLWTATLWVWSFLLLVVLVLVNIFLAMIFDTYGDVRSSVGHSATLWQTTKIVATHLKHTFSFGSESQKWVPNRQLVQAVKAMQCQHVTPWMVKDALPGISNRQVNYIFNLGKTRLENMLLRGNKSSLPAVVASILLGIERMHQGLLLMEGNSQKKVQEAADEKRRNSLVAEEKSKGKRLPAVGGDNMVDPPNEPPAWLKVQLLPHFQKQKNLLAQVHVQIQRIERAMHFRGQSPNIPPPSGYTPRNMKVRGALDPGSAVLPVGHTSETTKTSGLAPAARRAGLTATVEEKKSIRGQTYNQPGG